MWEHPYRCTRIQDGRQLLNCIRYVDLNMVRAGTIKHPSEWRWCSDDELTGQRQRYRIGDEKRRRLVTGFPSRLEFAEFYRASISERLAAKDTVREPWWTETVAVGSEATLIAYVHAKNILQRFNRNPLRAADPLLCPKCQKEMRIVSLIDERAVIARILRHLGLWAQGVRFSPARAPPEIAESSCRAVLQTLGRFARGLNALEACS